MSGGSDGRLGGGRCTDAPSLESSETGIDWHGLAARYEHGRQVTALWTTIRHLAFGSWFAQSVHDQSFLRQGVEVGAQGTVMGSDPATDAVHIVRAPVSFGEVSANFTYGCPFLGDGPSGHRRLEAGMGDRKDKPSIRTDGPSYCVKGRG